MLGAQGIVRRVLLAVLFAVTLLAGLAAGQVTARQDDPGPDRVVNLELILDASGSMAEEIEPDVARIDAAKSVLDEVIDSLPQSPNVNVGFRVYGHQGSNTEAGRALSCRSTELKVPIQGVDIDALRAEVEAYEPVGWTPLALSLSSSADDFPLAADGIVNAVVLVTDGLETCGGDPCVASSQIKNGPSGITTHVIGFALAPEEQSNLQCIVDASGGLLLGAGNATELSAALFEVLQELEVVQTEPGRIEIEAFAGVYPAATVTGGVPATDSAPDSTTGTWDFAASSIVEVPAGTYDVTWTNPSGSTTTIQVLVQSGETTFIRGSLLQLPQGAGDVYVLALDGTVIWEDTVDLGDVVWLLPGTYRLEATELSATTTLITMTVQTQPGTVTAVSVMTMP
jgi:Mg-chelatase subunit ChlD